MQQDLTGDTLLGINALQTVPLLLGHRHRTSQRIFAYNRPSALPVRSKDQAMVFNGFVCLSHNALGIGMEGNLPTAGAIFVDDGQHRGLVIVTGGQQHYGYQTYQYSICFHCSFVLIVCKYQVVPPCIPNSTSEFPGVFLLCSMLVRGLAVLSSPYYYMRSLP